jgi:hypothetical protein
MRVGPTRNMRLFTDGVCIKLLTPATFAARGCGDEHRVHGKRVHIKAERLGRLGEAARITSVLVRTSLLRPSQSAQLSEAIIFFRF